MENLKETTLTTVDKSKAQRRNTRAGLWTLLFATMTLTAACTADTSDWNNGSSNGNNGNSSDNSSSVTYSSSITDLINFDISLDKTALTEEETVPTDGDDAEDYIENNTFSNVVNIAFDGTTATTSGTVDGVSVSISGADVMVKSTTKKVRYNVSGTTSDGFLKIYSDNKFELDLNGVNITNPDGAAINIQSKKRGYIVLAANTTNTLTDGTSYSDATDDEDMKACFFSEGKMLFSGTGTLEVYANCKAGIRSDDYVTFRPGNNIYVKATAGNAIKANDAIYIKGGVINVETSAAASKGLSSDGIVQIDGGRTTAITTGTGALDDDGTDVSGCAGVKADSTFVMNGGALYCKSTGNGGKGINTSQTLTINGGTVKVITTGSQYVYGSMDTSAKGIKSTGAMNIKGGTIMVRCTGGEGSEGIESKSTMDISGGNIMAYCYDDALNSSAAMTISGGNIFALGTDNDGIDSNSTLTISGGLVIACGTTVPEGGFDCDENTFTVTGGTLIGIGGTTSTPTQSVTTQPVAILGGSSITSGQYITVADNSGNTILAFNVPRSYSQQGYTLVVSSPLMTQGNTYTFSSGATVSGGSSFCGYVTDAAVSGGSTFATMTLSSMITTYNYNGGTGGNGGGNQPGGNQPGGGGPGGGGR